MGVVTSLHQIAFTFLVPAHPGSPSQRAVKWVCVCVIVGQCCCLLTKYPSSYSNKTYLFNYFCLTDLMNGKIMWKVQA